MNIKRFLVIISAVIVIICGYTIFSTIRVIETTGKLSVKSTDPKAIISVGQNNSQPAKIGNGGASAHLSPGSYQVAASDNGYQTIMTVQITKKTTSSVSLNLASASKSANTAKLLVKLPIIGPAAAYQITTSVEAVGNSSGPVIIISSANQQARQAALQWIKDQGFDPANYNIKYQTEEIQNFHYTNGLP